MQLEMLARVITTSQGNLTFVLHQLVNVVVPTKDNLEHVESEVIWGALGPKVGRAERHIAKSGFCKGKEIHVLVFLGLLWASEDFLAQGRRRVPGG